MGLVKAADRERVLRRPKVLPVMANVPAIRTARATASVVTGPVPMLLAMVRAPKVAPIPKPVVPAIQTLRATASAPKPAVLVMTNVPAIRTAHATASAVTDPVAMRVPKVPREVSAVKVTHHAAICRLATNVLPATDRAPKANAVRIPKASHA